MLRTIFERLSRNRVIRRRLPPEFGARPLYVSPDAALRLWHHDLKEADPMLFRLARELVKPGAAVWDIGANVGLFSFAAAAIAGPSGSVLAVEPDPWLSSLLRRSAGLDWLHSAPVTVLSVAIADVHGIAQLNIAKRGRASNFISGFGSTQSSGARESLSVLTVTLDWLAERYGKPTLVKIDVEGMEHLVLRGAGNVLSHTPPLIIEVARGNCAEVAALLERARYTILNDQLRLTDSMPFNLVAVPQQMKSSLTQQ